MWEPFTEQARHAVVRAQEVAQMFASSFIGTHHIVFALAESDDDLGRALAGAVDREQLRAALGAANAMPHAEMVFTPQAKRSIELAFEHARRLGHNYIAAAHLALGTLEAESPPLKAGVDLAALHAELSAIAAAEPNAAAGGRRGRWDLLNGAEEMPAALRALSNALSYFPDLGPAGTQVRVTLIRPGESEESWTWQRSETP